MSLDWDRLLDIFKKHERFAVTCHANPEGDALGSVVSISRFLKSLGKEVTQICPDPVPALLEFLDPDKEIQVYRDDVHGPQLSQHDVVLIVDVSSPIQLGALGNRLPSVEALTVSIDHHATHEPFTKENFVNKNASSTGEMIYQLIEYTDSRIDPVSAMAIYVAIMTDTGSFRFSNTGLEAHRIAGELIKLGVSPSDMHGRIYERDGWEKAFLLKKVLGTLESADEGRIACLRVTQDMFDSTGAKEEDLEGFVNYPLSVEKVAMSLLIRDRPDGTVKVSLRSKGRIDVSALAAAFGGGGHPRAAGILTKGNVESTQQAIVQKAKSMLEEAD